MFLRAKSSLGSKNKIFIADFLTKRKFCFIITNKNVFVSTRDKLGYNVLNRSIGEHSG